MKSNVKKLLASLLTVIFVFSAFVGTGAASVLEDGTYEISYDGLHITEDKLSAADTMGSLIKPAKLEVNNGNIVAFITISGSPVKYENNAGNMVPAEITKENGDQRTYKFKLANLDAPIIIGTHVAAVGIDVEYRIVFKKDTLKKISDDVSSSSSSAATASNPQTSDTIFSTLSSLGLVMSLLLVATVVVNKRKAVRNEG
ncbi:hypothetical protein BKP45_14370 [Anaerobacillus alkalidiazotrophicus]|uniref:NEAT domain-containing protein n=1 Tax=Anaerobacillus alkalidiazotrophicus TaxID=472963 RepID=A0A1S2M2Y0_9BACI|nr:NEAT domain-containing protein [Anaerobacillus alkalidiazotrophicus]OIJ19038.1 hypothetical protein BKP45_14370 [Anaerobacillus alkalidiazotrophicus]